MRYKGFKQMKCAAAVILSAAIVLTDVSGVSAAEYGQTLETEVQEETTQSLAQEDTAEEDAAVESETLQETVEISDEITETQPEITHTEGNTEIDTDAGSTASDFSGETEPAETREETPSTEITETTEGTDLEAEGMEIKAAVEDFRLNQTSVTLIINETFDLKKKILFTPENAENKTLVCLSDNTSVATVSEDGMISAVGAGDATITIRLADGALDKTLTFAVKVSDEANIIRFKLYDDTSDAEITKTTISVGEPVVIQAVFGTQPPMDATLQWSSSKPAYVKTTQRTNLINTSAVELEGLKPTPTNDPAVITCVLTYPDKTQVTAMLDVTVKPLAESVTISLGKEDATGKEVIYDLEEKQFIAIGTMKLSEPVSELSASISPIAADQRIRWSSSDSAVIKFDDEESGKAVGNKNGEATVTAAPYVLHGKGADGKEVKGTVRVKTRRIIKSLSFTPKTSDKKDATHDSYGRIEITEGMKITLEPTYMPADATVKRVKWSINSNTPNALDISVNETTNIATVTAKKVAKNTVVKLTADATDMGEASCELEFIVKPKVEKIYIYRKDDQNTCLSGGTLGVDQSGTVDLIAVNKPDDAMQKVTWKISNTKIADLTPKDDGSCTITVKDKGTAQITATAADSSKVTAVTTLNVSSLARSVTIEGSDKVMVGGKIKLTASVSPKSASSKNIKWESLMPEFATVDEKTGVVTGLATSSRDSVTTATIKATVQDGSGKSITHNVLVYAAPEKFDIMIPDGDKDEKNDIILTGKTIGIDPDTDKTTYKVAARILPQKACQEVEWKSSNEKIATVDKNGVITAHDAFGKATITASAIDGSNRKASITVNVATLVTSVEITGGHYVGYSNDEDIELQLKAVVGKKDAANKSVVWKSEYPSVAEVDETGLVTANAKTGSTEITAEAVDGSGIIAKHMVYVVSSKNKVTINRDDSSADKWIIDSKGGRSIEGIDLAGKETVEIRLRADLSGGSPERDGVPMELKWSTSDKNVATVEADETDSHKCTVTLHNKGVSGKKTVKITATTTEGYATSGSVTIKDIENTNPYVTITGPGHRLANGKKMQLSSGSIAVKWYSENEALAKVDIKKGVVTAGKDATGTVRITAVSEVGTGWNTYDINIVPLTSKVDITLNGDTNIVTNQKVGVDIIKGYGNQEELKLGARLDNVPSEEVTWKSSNKSIAVIDEDGNLDIKKTGNVTLTATATDGSKKSGKVTLVVTKQITSMEPAGGKRNIVVGLKKSVQLNVTYKPLGTTIKKATWSVTQESSPGVVSVNKNNGKVTGKALGWAEITAIATDGSGKSCKFNVSVEPAVSKVEIISARLGEYSNVVGVDLSSGEYTDTLSVNLYEYDKVEKEYNPIADQDVTWSSSNKAIAEIDKDGKVTVHKAGTVTIKATATDGSRKSATIKLYAGQLVKTINVDPSVPATINLSLGDKNYRTYNLAGKISVSPLTASNKTLVFTSTNKKCVTVNSKGKITAKKVNDETVYIIITTKDGSGVSVEIPVEVN
ncbi:MAG: Ig-like domain-containing protein [Lachnospiraceae bacterium]|nr:Ig-like domain-containing protein [Lachnospiraceae bacterium]